MKSLVLKAGETQEMHPGNKQAVPRDGMSSGFVSGSWMGARGAHSHGLSECHEGSVGVGRVREPGRDGIVPGALTARA